MDIEEEVLGALEKCVASLSMLVYVLRKAKQHRPIGEPPPPGDRAGY